jgi:signal transduction histidine kinase
LSPKKAHFATLGRLAAGLSHEIRNPLGTLFLHIDLLEEEFREPTPESPTVIVQTFGEIRMALTRLEALVQDYLSLVRVGTIELDVQDVAPPFWASIWCGRLLSPMGAVSPWTASRGRARPLS